LPEWKAKPDRSISSNITSLQLFEAHIKAAKLAPETIIRRRVVFAELDARLNAKSFDALSEDEAQKWITSRVAPNRAAQTVRKIYIASLKAVGRWAVKQRVITRNPFENCSIVVPKKIQNRETRAFTSEEVLTILTAASGSTAPTRRRMPWLCAYTGARAGEVTQLRGKDIIERDGIKAIRITPEAGTVKTKQTRVVPIHEHLIDQGLLEFVKQRGSGPLFYKARSADGASAAASARSADPTKPQHARSVHVRSKLAQWIRSIGIRDREVSPTHGWRHTFKQTADRCGISERVSDQIEEVSEVSG
jgi:integrase